MSSGERDRVAAKHTDDLRRLRFLSGLLSRVAQMGTGHAKAKLEAAQSLRDDRRQAFTELDQREQELLVAKLLRLVDGQLEVVSICDAASGPQLRLASTEIVINCSLT